MVEIVRAEERNISDITKLWLEYMRFHEDIHAVAGYCALNGITRYIQEYQDFGGTWHSAININNVASDSDETCSAWLNICIYPNGDVVKCFDHFRLPEAIEPLGNIGKESMTKILSSRRCTQIIELMKHCNLSCKRLRCNQREVVVGSG